MNKGQGVVQGTRTARVRSACLAVFIFPGQADLFRRYPAHHKAFSVVHKLTAPVEAHSTLTSWFPSAWVTRHLLTMQQLIDFSLALNNPDDGAHTAQNAMTGDLLVGQDTSPFVGLTFDQGNLSIRPDQDTIRPAASGLTFYFNGNSANFFTLGY